MPPLALLLGGAVVLLGSASAVASTSGAPRTGAGLKMAAASTYLAQAWAGGAWDTAYGRLVLVALALCWLGDLCLVAPGSGRAFLAGLASFLLGHAAYAAAFWVRGVHVGWAAVGVVGAGAVGVAVARWLARHEVPPAVRAPVRAYIAVIALMVASSIGTPGASGPWAVPAGAAAFMASDVFVARERFVTSSALNVRVGLPLYFLAQALLAGSV